MRATKQSGNREGSLELKYCERCGGLWLRPVGGGQIYCTICAQAIAELPPPSTEASRTRGRRRKSLDFNEEFEAYSLEEIDLDSVGGAA